MWGLPWVVGGDSCINLNTRSPVYLKITYKFSFRPHKKETNLNQDCADSEMHKTQDKIPAENEGES